ncbi:low temperature requirement protein A [Enterococcus wangshanyuanii]|uniref:Bacitracin ABC transporter permease n=1 Tax=Enterococcus wangshanyuanii TaxID=2005703 RepID=A0ABQ1NLH5_9ENTE|nr:low temperature requirement protein A [Enterococcus wangshanyuanii]GGC77236.1 bacitracin ABC transporter permease [Enterococcus wangshanyuanii]
MQILKKEVTEFELFYDLIFAYAISRIASILLVGTDHLLSFKSIGEFLMLTLVFWTIWTYQTVFANRFSIKNKLSALFLFFDMFWVIVLAQSINVDFERTHFTFAGATSILFFSIALQYYLKMKSTDNEIIRKLCIQLAAVLVVSGVIGFISILPFGNYWLRFSIYVCSIFITAFFPIVTKKALLDFPTNFEHLTERYSLFTLLLFGEAVIAIASTILFNDIQLSSVLFFLLIVVMFLFYNTIYKSGIDRQKTTAGLVLIHSHYFVFAGLELSIVLYESYVKSEIDPLFFVLCLAGSLICFLGGTLVNMVIYTKKEYNYLPFISKNVLYFVGWVVIGLLLQDYVAPFLFVNIIFLLFFLYKVKQELKIQAE